MQGQPVYLSLSESELEQKVDSLWHLLAECRLCPRNCAVNRLKGQTGYCKTGSLPFVSSWGPHYGEEAPLVGRYGSGTIFFGKCNLQCIFCQNYEISIQDEGMEMTFYSLADLMIDIQNMGCHNLNLVTPTHQIPMILKSLQIAVKKGLSIPIVYNCGGYESVQVIKILEDIVDIYMPDIKFTSAEVSKQIVKADDYFERCKEAVKEMYRQVGRLQVRDKIAKRGMIIRHLVLPNDLAGTEEVVRFIATELSPDLFVNIMNQYYPHYKAKNMPALNTPLSQQEYKKAVMIAQTYLKDLPAL